MHEYRLYSLSPEAMIVRWNDQSCSDDENALAGAVGMRKHAEIWCGRRVVRSVKRSGRVVA